MKWSTVGRREGRGSGSLLVGGRGGKVVHCWSEGGEGKWFTVDPIKYKLSSCMMILLIIIIIAAVGRYLLNVRNLFIVDN